MISDFVLLGKSVLGVTLGISTKTIDTFAYTVMNDIYINKQTSQIFFAEPIVHVQDYEHLQNIPFLKLWHTIHGKSGLSMIIGDNAIRIFDSLNSENVVPSEDFALVFEEEE